MGWIVRHIDRIAATLLLTCGGAGLGMLASTLTADAVVWRSTVEWSATQARGEAPRVDQFAAGRSWAQAAFDGGLRRCPEMNADFVAACQAEMKALAARPTFAAGSYGGPLLITTYTPPSPEIAEEPVVEAEPEVEPLLVDETPPPAVMAAAFEPTPENYPAAPSNPQ